MNADILFLLVYRGGDDVQSSIELLDRVLSEFDDMENANQVQNVRTIIREIVKIDI